ncbi:hypothetical protein ONS95_009360 [Cadophora gregata]|uniref:uncharacterized protein n=1 Tax=Cadophora gregata TaxID=51156 RepID=UPI0026DC4FE0|nr:uncharacterized protein ONS95_009360 [Cadophora gregata]KAK0124399.1 hypothetical protein ONS95_009360 [Cadophora gregata]
MDTALITFMIQTPHSTQSVHLIGSWDNFTKHYPMERDIRRSRSQWRGCYTFEDIICDGDGPSSPKRTGGLKMGSTYYYYYELDDGTEHYDPSIPSTTACPYLPGQPVNLLFVPIEVQPLRYRSASMSSMANGDIKTMNPADKFMTPRAPPPPPSLPRLNTSSSVLMKKRSARSLSPKPEKSAWSPRQFFGLRLPSQPSSLPIDTRGRSSSLSKVHNGRSNASTPNLREEARRTKSVPHTREPSPQSFQKLQTRDPSPLRHLVQESTTYNTTTLEIPDEIEEEGEDDDNFASQLNDMSFLEKGITPLAPPPSAGLRSPPARQRSGSTAKDMQKPLPQLPEEELLPPPLRLRPAFSAADLPRSHFSTSTLATSLTSPSDSHFSFSSEHSISSDINDDDVDLAADVGSGDEFTYSPVLADIPIEGFTGYSLPEADCASEQTLRKDTPLSQLAPTSASRATFGATHQTTFEPEVEQMTALQQLLSEMGYLGDVIIGK